LNGLSVLVECFDDFELVVFFWLELEARPFTRFIDFFFDEDWVTMYALL